MNEFTGQNEGKFKSILLYLSNILNSVPFIVLNVCAKNTKFR